MANIALEKTELAKEIIAELTLDSVNQIPVTDTELKAKQLAQMVIDEELKLEEDI